MSGTQFGSNVIGHYGSINTRSDALSMVDGVKRDIADLLIYIRNKGNNLQDSEIQLKLKNIIAAIGAAPPGVMGDASESLRPLRDRCNLHSPNEDDSHTIGIKSVRKCESCGDIYEKKEVLDSLILHTDGGTKVSEGLQNLLMEESLEDHECASCNLKGKTKRKTEILSLPADLIIQSRSKKAIEEYPSHLDPDQNIEINLGDYIHTYKSSGAILYKDKHYVYHDILRDQVVDRKEVVEKASALRASWSNYVTLYKWTKKKVEKEEIKAPKNTTQNINKGIVQKQKEGGRQDNKKEEEEITKEKAPGSAKIPDTPENIF